MDEFVNLNWSWNTNRLTTSKLYEANVSDDEKDIFLCHLNEIDHVHLLDNYGKNYFHNENASIRKDPRTGLEVTKELHDHRKLTRKNLFDKFPHQSSMNSKQHEICLNAIIKMKYDDSTISMNDRQDRRTYKQLIIERNKEKAEFLEFVKGEFFKRNIKNCHNLQPELNKFITKQWKDSVEKVITSNDDYYQLQSAISLSLSNNNDDISIHHEKTVHEVGVIMAVNRKKYTNPIQYSCSFLEYFFSNAEVSISYENVQVGEPVDVVITLKTLESILSYARDYSAEWNIKFSLRNCNNDTMIVFDEIFPSTSLGCLERNRQAYKYGLIAGITVPKKQEIFSLKEKRFLQREPPISDECSTSILSQTLVSEYKVCHYEEYLKKFNDSTSAANSSADSNTIRRIWKIKKNNIAFCRLVIDNSQDVCEKQSDGTVQFINLSPKIDYQSEFGAEQMSLSELITEWCELLFGPNTITDRVRIDPITNSVLKAKQVTIADVEDDLQRLYQVRPDSLLEPLCNVIETIKGFPPNVYMLRHQRKHNTQAMVYVKSSDKSSPNTIKVGDIYESHNVDTSNLEIVPWIPIDDTICTSIHKENNIMPCAFPPWGKKRKGKSNDRLHLVKRAQQKSQEKSEAILNRSSRIKSKKKATKRKAKKAIMKDNKKVILKFEGEALDPSELFDQQGNIQVNNFIHQNEVNDIPKGEINSLETVSYESYLRDAAVDSDDSIDTSDLSHTKRHQC